MTNTKNLQTWYDEVWNNANEKHIHEALHPNAVVHGLQTDSTKEGMMLLYLFIKVSGNSFQKLR
jgi:hypothetical protein